MARAGPDSHRVTQSSRLPPAEPAPPASDVPEWRRAAARMRRLQLAQLSVLLLLVAVTVGATLAVTDIDPGALAEGIVALFVLGGVLVWLLLDRAGRRVVEALVDATREQRALRRVATSVMTGDDLERTLAVVAREVGGLSGAAVVEVVRARAGGPPVALWSDARMRAGAGPRVLGTLAAMRRRADEGDRPRVRSLRDSDTVPDRELAAAGLDSAAAVPVIAGGALWGALGVAFRDGPVSHETLDMVERFAEQAALVVERARGHSRLSAQAATDHLTGLANHRAFHERLTAEVAAAEESGSPLSLILLDLDDFRRVNEGLGHQVGDQVLAEAARRLGRAAAEGELVARIGGEEFAWLMPGVAAMGAFAAAERVRLQLAERPLTPGVSMTLSAGVCDLAQAGDAAGLVRLADGALYWAKHNGRDLTCLYSPETVHEVSDAERADRLERLRSLEGLRALARAVDARDPYTQRHSERVAQLARRLAIGLGWSEQRADELREAGLVHDVGKIGVPDAVLLKPAALDAEERAQIVRHAALGARIVADILGPEATAWVRSHHERVDGAGYPDGLAGDEIPEGARILALADTWDAMTTDRPYRRGMSLQDALAECRRCSGAQLWPPGVAVLEGLLAPPARPGGHTREGGRSPGWMSPVS